MRSGAAVLAVTLAVLPAAGCQSSWVQLDERTETVITNVVVDTEPPGAVVSFNGKRQDAAPVRIPVKYAHAVQLWSRSTNSGASIRESTGAIGTVLLFPVWLLASFVQYEEQNRRHVYGGNTHEVSASFGGGAAVSQTVVLNGEDEISVSLKR